MTTTLTAPSISGGQFLLQNAAPSDIFTPEEFTAEDDLFARTASDFLRKEVMPHVERIEGGDHPFMRQLMQKAGELGLLAVDVPEIYGGLGASHMTSALVAEKLNPQQSFALTHEVQSVISILPILFFGNHDQKSRYIPKLASGEWIGSFALSEADSGSDSLAMRTSGVLSGDGKTYVLNGTKMWITNTAFADLFNVFGKVGDKVTMFLVERTFPGVSFGKEEHKLGMHGTSTRRVILENVAVPIENVLEVGKGHYAAFCGLNMGRFKLEAGAVGGLKYLLETCAEYAQQRKAFGKPIGDYGLVKHKLAEMAGRAFGLESMVYRLAGDLEKVFSQVQPDAEDASIHFHKAAEEFAIECSIVKVLGSEAYSEMADEAIQVHGGYGYTEEFPVARAWRDQRLLRIGEGANEIVRGVIINTLLRRDRAGRLPILEAGKSGGGNYIGESSSVQDDDIGSILDASYVAKGYVAAYLAEADNLLGGMPGLAEAQEIGAAIADIVCAAYGLESVGLRLQKMGIGSAKFGSALLAGKVAALGYDRIVASSIHYLDQNLEGIKIDARHAALRFRETPMQLRRLLADRSIERRGYPI